MKRFLAILLLVSYSIASFGLSIDFDFCCGELESISISAPHSNTDDCAAQNTDDDCCSNTHLDIKKIEDKQLFSEQINLKLAPQNALFVLPNPIYFSCSKLAAASFPTAVLRTEPPPPSLLSRQVLFCNFRV